MFQNLKRIINSNVGKIIVSIILGLGLASLFKNKCENNSCLEYVSPNLEEIKKYVYMFDNECYKFESSQIKCKKDKNIKTINV